MRSPAFSSRILDRYLLAEAGGAWLAVTVVLLAIMLSTRFAFAQRGRAVVSVPVMSGSVVFPGPAPHKNGVRADSVPPIEIS